MRRERYRRRWVIWPRVFNAIQESLGILQLNIKLMYQCVLLDLQSFLKDVPYLCEKFDLYLKFDPVVFNTDDEFGYLSLSTFVGLIFLDE